METNDEFEIFPPYEAFYLVSLLFCTESALRSAEWVSDFFEQLQKDEKLEFNPQLLLNQMQNIVLQGAAISRYFWPTEPAKKRHAARGKRLREAFAVTDDSPLKSRKLRNQMEHFDERLDDYLGKGIFGHVIPHYVGRTPESGGVREHFFQAYFIDTGTFSILGETYQIEPIAREIARIHDLLIACEQSGSRLPAAEKTDQG